MKRTSLRKIRIFSLGGSLFFILLTVCSLWYADIMITYKKSISQLSQGIRLRELDHIKLSTEEQSAFLDNIADNIKEESLVFLVSKVRIINGKIIQTDKNYSSSLADSEIIKEISLLLNSASAKEPFISFITIHNNQFINKTKTIPYSAKTLYDYCKTNKEGFFPYIKQKESQEILSDNLDYIYLKYHEPLDLCFGAILHTEAIDKKIKEAINKHLRIVNTNKTDFFFTATIVDDSLTEISTHWEIINSITPYNVNNNVFFQNLKSGNAGGFIKCDATSVLNGTTKLRLCYITPLVTRNQVLGFGKYKDDIDAIINADAQYLTTGRNRSLTAVASVLIVFIILSVMITLKLSGIIFKQTAIFKNNFLKAIQDGTPLELSSLYITELIEFANEINKLLATRKYSENMMKKSIAEKEILIKEIHHRVKNNLQIIISLIDLQTLHTDNPSTITLLKETSGRIRSMGIIHEKIYQTKDLTEVPAKDYFSTIVDELMFSYNIDHNKIKIVKNIDDITFNMDTAIPLGLIINELLTNTIKHAFKKDQEGRIHISAKKFANRTEIIVSDNGIGIPIKEEMDKRSRLGMQLIRGLTMQLGAELSIIAKNGTKTKITLQNT
ncbi:MAG: sensor histidine kinase [Spirochaetes bacterium]|nr:sensor histidine kinase [Spirochaetota bacterium]